MKIAFYTGPQCGLCDLADEVIAQSTFAERLQIEKINIRDDAALYHLYAVRIPVLKRLDNEQELGWPFDVEMLEEFLS